MRQGIFFVVAALAAFGMFAAPKAKVTKEKTPEGCFLRLSYVDANEKKMCEELEMTSSVMRYRLKCAPWAGEKYTMEDEEMVIMMNKINVIISLLGTAEKRAKAVKKIALDHEVILAQSQAEDGYRATVHGLVRGERTPSSVVSSVKLMDDSIKALRAKRKSIWK